MAVDETTPLEPRQQAFVQEYLLDLNGTQAAIRAGYSPATAGSIASEYLTKPAIAAAVEKGKAQRLARVNVSADAVITEISILANSCVEHYFIDDEGQLRATPEAPEGAMRAVSSVKRRVTVKPNGDKVYDVEFKLWDKPGSLKLMGRHSGAKACFDKVEVTGKDGGPLEVITEVRRTVVKPGAE